MSAMRVLIVLLMAGCSSAASGVDSGADLTAGDLESGREGDLAEGRDLWEPRDLVGVVFDLTAQSVPDMAQAQPDLAPQCIPAQGQCPTGSSICCGGYACANFGISVGYICCIGQGASCTNTIDCCPVTGHNAICISSHCTYN